MLKNIFLKTLSTALNKVLALDPDTFERLKQLAGKTLAIELTNLKLTLFLSLTEKGFKVADQNDQTADITITGTTLAFIKLRAQQSMNLYKSDVKITGDMGLADELRKIFSRLDIDWEGGLSQYTGETAAYHIGKAVRGGMQWLQRTHENLQQASKEYCQEEIRVLPTRVEMDHFTREVSRLRDDVERLSARLATRK